MIFHKLKRLDISFVETSNLIKAGIIIIIIYHDKTCRKQLIHELGISVTPIGQLILMRCPTHFSILLEVILLKNLLFLQHYPIPDPVESGKFHHGLL